MLPQATLLGELKTENGSGGGSGQGNAHQDNCNGKSKCPGKG